jgi:hypothetical protein
MSVRALKWIGIVTTVAAILGLIGYFADVGLNEANELAGPIGAIVGVIGIGLTGYAMIGSKSPPSAGAGEDAPPRAGTDGDTVNTIEGGHFHGPGPVILARDVHYDARPPGGTGHPGASDPGTPQTR